MNISSNPKLTPQLVSDGRISSFHLVDVGVSGGIDKVWRVFGAALCATGFDPLNYEVARLNREERNPRVRYVADAVGYRGYTGMMAQDWDKANDTAFFRSSAVRAQEIKARAYDSAYDPEGRASGTPAWSNLTNTSPARWIFSRPIRMATT